MEFNPTEKKIDSRVAGIIGCSDDRILRYILLMYDKNSPMISAYQNLQQRKQAAATIAGFDLSKEDVGFLFEFKCDEKYGDPIGWIMNFLRYQNNLLWCLIVSQEQAFYEFTARVIMPVAGDKDKDILSAVNIKNSIMTSQDEIITRLDKYYRQLSGGDDNLEAAIKTKKRFTPESVMNG